MIDLLFDALAAYRLTRLVTADTITRPLRARWIRAAYVSAYEPDSDWALSERTEAEWDRIPRDDDDAPKLAEFVTCPYCVGIWISGLVVLFRRYAHGAWSPLAKVLALSAIAALMRGLEQD